MFALSGIVVDANGGDGIFPAGTSLRWWPLVTAEVAPGAVDCCKGDGKGGGWERFLPLWPLMRSCTGWMVVTILSVVRAAALT